MGAPPPDRHAAFAVGGELTSVGPEYGARERRMLEAEILDKLKRRGDAQDLRWREFAETLDPAILKLYLSKLDDFAEFDEMDRAFALVEEAEDIYGALDFFVTWPRLDRAAALVLRHDDRWEGRYYRGSRAGGRGPGRPAAAGRDRALPRADQRHPAPRHRRRLSACGALPRGTGPSRTASAGRCAPPAP